MPATQVFSANNVAIPASPPQVHLPTDAGVAIPAGKTAWTLSIDLSSPVPAGQSFGMGVEYQRGAWTDAAGVVHPSGEWLPDSNSTWTTGTFTRNSVTTGVHSLSSSIGALFDNGVMVEPYPTHARIRLDQSGAWTLPNVTLTLS